MNTVGDDKNSQLPAFGARYRASGSIYEPVGSLSLGCVFHGIDRWIDGSFTERLFVSTESISDDTYPLGWGFDVFGTYVVSTDLLLTCRSSLALWGYSLDLRQRDDPYYPEE